MRFCKVILPAAATILGMIELTVGSSFAANCQHPTLSGWVLHATCNNVQSTLDLRNCLANGAGGNLVCQPA